MLIPDVNPPWDSLGTRCAIVGGRATRYRVDEFAGPLSLKTVLAGSAEFRTRHGRHWVRPGDTLIVNAGSPYSMRIDSSEPVITLSVFLPAGLLGWAVAMHDYMASDGPSPSGNADPILIERVRPMPQSMMNALLRLDHWRSSSDRDPMLGEAAMLSACNAWAELALAEQAAIERCPGRTSAHRRELCRRLHLALDFLHAHYAEPLTVSRLAGIACISPFHFQRLFKRHFGMTPMQALRSCRMQRARELLDRGELSVAAVAQNVGFASPATFSHVYRRLQGRRPNAQRGMKTQS